MIIRAILVFYLMGAGFLGNAIYNAIPAMNILGATYAGAIWPVSFVCGQLEIKGCLMPSESVAIHLFNFDPEFIKKKYEK